MKIDGQAALVTGANRGLGRHLAQQLRDRGAKVYAGARNPQSVDLEGVTPIALDITDPASVATAADATGNVSILVNNAGTSTGASLLTGDLADIRLELDTHFFGTLSVIRAFAPQLGANESSAVLNILSVLSWISFPQSGAYCAAKSASWSLTSALRQELAPRGRASPRCTSATWTPTWSATSTRPRPTRPTSPAPPSTASRPAPTRSSPTKRPRPSSAGLSGGVAALYPQLP